MLRLCCSIGIGILIGSAVVAVVGPPGAAAWAIPVGLLVAVPAGSLALVGRSLRGLSVPDPELAAQAVAAGRMGLARVDRLSQTGSRVNEQPICEIECTVVPARGDAYRTVVRRIVPLIEIPQLQPGTVRVVAILAEGQPDIAWTDESPDAEAWAGVEIPPAEIAGSLRRPGAGALRADGSRRRPLIGIGSRGRAWRLVAFTVAALLAAIAVVLPYRAGVAETLEAIPQGRVHADLREPRALERAFAAVSAAVGHDEVLSVTVSEDLVSVIAPVEPHGLDADRWTYRRGVVRHDGPASSQPETAEESFPLSEIDAAGVLASLQLAAEEAGATGIDGMMYSAERTLVTDPADPWTHERSGPVSVWFQVSDGYRTAAFAVGADGHGLTRTDAG